MSGNAHTPHECPYCWRVLYSKGALTNHVNNEHWKELEAEKQTDFDGFPICEYKFGEKYLCASAVKKWGDRCSRHSDEVS